VLLCFDHGSLSLGKNEERSHFSHPFNGEEFLT
jgi:hypothetical protein